MRLKILATLLLSFVTLSCASQNQTAERQMFQRGDNVSVTIDKSFDSLWDNALAYLKSDEIRMTVRNAERGYIETNYLNLKSSELKQYINVSGQRLSSTSRVRMKSTIYLWRVNQSETLVKIFTSAEVYEEPGRYSNGGWFMVNSNGSLERELAHGIRDFQNLAEK
ncbi:MAG: hypothetical protein GF372_00640 [Candidatus Marinimicrobia bacterium]|nr:hypothetical protein [Candidatus Neomarinimicrobiota bacterium]